jgi:chromosome segregation ATPase
VLERKKWFYWDFPRRQKMREIQKHLTYVFDTAKSVKDELDILDKIRGKLLKPFTDAEKEIERIKQIDETEKRLSELENKLNSCLYSKK